ncbi:MULTISPECIES: hypothetical protein [unclassified Streptomyces]|uniref:hypothetical protein n=1 Tax=unclassified Streptomyces TaxID=2593676 RepID=UPI002E2ECA9D|nr:MULTISPECIES: hypothetical protein [unclassified Streptomyces]
MQDLTVGYGYRPMRAVWWLCVIMLSGVLLFTRRPSRPVDPGKPPHFQAAIYAFDLVLPLVDFGQEQAFSPRGGLQWAAVVLVCLGWLLATTAAAGADRVLRRTWLPPGHGRRRMIEYAPVRGARLILLIQDPISSPGTRRVETDTLDRPVPRG